MEGEGFTSKGKAPLSLSLTARDGKGTDAAIEEILYLILDQRK